MKTDKERWIILAKIFERLNKMFGNPKGEVIKCRKCDRWFDILRGTACVCACGEKVISKKYSQEKMNKLFNLSKTQANPEDLSANEDFTAQSVSPQVCPQCRFEVGIKPNGSMIDGGVELCQEHSKKSS